MIKTTEPIIVIRQGQANASPLQIFSKIIESRTDWLNEKHHVVYQDFYYIEPEVEYVIREKEFTLSFDEFNNLLTQMGGSITSKQDEKNIMDQAHTYIKNNDQVYGVTWEVHTNQ